MILVAIKEKLIEPMKGIEDLVWYKGLNDKWKASLKISGLTYEHQFKSTGHLLRLWFEVLGQRFHYSQIKRNKKKKKWKTESLV